MWHIVKNSWIMLQHQNLKYKVGVVHRHPRQNITSFHKELEKTLESLKTDKEFYYVGGDLSIIFLSSQNSIKRYTDMLYSQECVPIITHPTHITGTSSTIIDHIRYLHK